jgi:hypothetical protein
MVKTKKRGVKRKKIRGGYNFSDLPSDTIAINGLLGIIESTSKSDEEKEEEFIKYLESEPPVRMYGKNTPRINLLTKDLGQGQTIMHILAHGEGEGKEADSTCPIKIPSGLGMFKGYIRKFEEFLAKHPSVLKHIQEKTNVLNMKDKVTYYEEDETGKRNDVVLEKTPIDHASDCNNNILTKKILNEALGSAPPASVRPLRVNADGGSRKGFKRRASSKKSKRSKTSKKL